MTQYPLLFFPDREEVTRSKLNGGGGNIHKPSTQRQGERLSPRFNELCTALEAKRFQLQQSSSGIDPEEVLVLETVGSIEEFAKSVVNIEGFEWLGEIEIDDIEPDDDFYDEKSEAKYLKGRLYLISTNIAAMNQLLSLWNQFIQDPNIKFQRGFGKFKDVFKQLKYIRRWDVQDRFDETNVLNIWKQNLELAPDQVIRFEIELWYRNNIELRQQSFSSVQSLLNSMGGNVVTFSEISEISYHAILAELPASEIRNIINNLDVALVKCDNIMYFRPSGQIIMDNTLIEESGSDLEISDNILPVGEPIVAIFDGYPLANHEILAGRLQIDDPDNIDQAYQANERKHGTAMCSLIVKGDINNNQGYISCPLYVRPIMKPNEYDRTEYVPNDILLVDTIHRAVKRMFEGDNDETPSAPMVKVINLSIGDPDRVFYNTMSPLSKLLDWLSFKYKVLFIVSSGNNYNEIILDISQSEFNQLSKIEQEKIFVKKILNNSRNCRLMSPAETINNITVGATHSDFTIIDESERRLNPYSNIFPSTYTSIGSGYRRAIKPDLVYDGGRQMYEFDIIQNNVLKPTRYKRKPGILVAAPDSTLSKTMYELGTSNSAALMTRNGYFCYEALSELMQIHDIGNQFISILIKAMLIHGCSWDNIGDFIEERLDSNLDAYAIKKIKSKWIGYGYPNINKAIECSEQRATVIGFGELSEEEAHIYKLPIPPSLASQTIKRRLTITLSWFSPIAATTQRYRTSKLWFEAKNKMANKRINSDDKAVKRGTIQHEVFEGASAEAFVDGDVINIKVNCSKDATSYSDEIPYAIIVTLEVAEAINLPIYQEIKERIVVPVSVEQRI